jgi:long-chain acyl-CoA synthetase
MTPLSLKPSVGCLISDAAARFGDKTAVVTDERQWSFRALDDISSRVAHALQARGIGKGQTISLYSANCSEWIIAYYAVMKIGGIVNPLNLMLTPEEATFAMADCGAVAVFGSDKHIAALARATAQTQLMLKVSYGGIAPAGAVDFDALIADASIEVSPTEIDIDQPCTVAYAAS